MNIPIFLDFFFTWTIKKIFIEFVTILSLFYVLFFGMRSIWDLKLPDQRSNPHPLHWKAKSQLLDHQESPQYTNFCLSIYQLVDICVVPTLGLL